MPGTRPSGYGTNVEPRMGPKDLCLGRVVYESVGTSNPRSLLVRISESTLDTLNPNLHFHKIPRPVLCSENTLQNCYIFNYGTKTAVV